MQSLLRGRCFFQLLKLLKLLKLALCAHGGYSSVGRASDCGSECRGFEPHYPPKKTNYLLVVRFFYFFRFSGGVVGAFLGCRRAERWQFITEDRVGNSAIRFNKISARLGQGANYIVLKKMSRMLFLLIFL